MVSVPPGIQKPPKHVLNLTGHESDLKKKKTELDDANHVKIF